MKPLEERIADRKRRLHMNAAQAALSTAAITTLQDTALAEGQKADKEAGVQSAPPVVTANSKKSDKSGNANPFAKK